MIPDRKLSEHFGFYELTQTSNAGLQERNRELSPDDNGLPETLAAFAENVRKILGGPMRIHSGYRCPMLNGATAGSAKTSEHMAWGAIDFDEPGIPVEETFRKLLEAARAGQLRFGQLILEQANRGFQTDQWVHISTGRTLAREKLGQAMTMKSGPDGHQVYTLIEQVRFT